MRILAITLLGVLCVASLAAKAEKNMAISTKDRLD